jgi:phytoene desaturase
VRRVVIIGAGLAGLSAAAALAARGAAVTVLEAEPDVGGKVRRVCAAGARVDVGPTILTDLAPLRRLFEESGASLHERLVLTRIDPGIVATFAGGARVALYADPARMPGTLAALGPNAAEDWRRFLDLGARAERLAEHYYRRGDFCGPAGLVRFVSGGGVAMRDVAPFARRSSLEAMLDASIRTPELRRLLAHFARFLGLDAAWAPAVALVIPYLCATAGVWYPSGGVMELAVAVADLARERGAVVELGERVERLECEASRVTAAVTASGRRVPADRFVSAIDVAAAARLVGRGGFHARRRLVPAMAAHVAWWVVEGRVPRTPHHVLHFGEDPRAEPTYIATPTATDPHIAPPGLAVVYALVHRPAGTAPEDGFADRMLQRVTAAGLWPPGRVVARGVAAGSGSCYGYAIGPGLLASARPSQRVRELGNLVLAGGSVFPGPGLSNVVRSGLRAAELVHDAAPERAA